MPISLCCKPLALLPAALATAVQNGGEIEGVFRRLGRFLDQAFALFPWNGIALILALAGVVAIYLYGRFQSKKAEERFRPLFEAAPGAMVLLNKKGRVVETNAAAAALLQRPKRHVLGETLHRLLEAEGQQQDLEATLAALGAENVEGQEAATIERQITVPGGGAVQVRLHFNALQRGGRHFYVAALQDMTDISEQQALFKFFHRKTMDDLPVEVAVLSSEGTYLYANPKAVAKEISQQWLQGKTDFDLCRRLGMHPEVALRRRSHRRRALQTGRRVSFEEVLPRRDAPPRHVKRYYTPIREEDGKVYAVVTYGVDKTRFKQQQETLESAREESKDFTQMKTNLMRNLRHEFRTPLTSILGATDVLKADVSEQQQEFVEIIEQGGQRLMHTLNAMLDLTSLQGGSVDQNPRVLSLGEAVEQVIEELKEPAARKDLFLRSQTPDEDVLVRVDPAGLYRVLRGLIGNAVKFTRAGGGVVEVEEEDGQAQVRVIDTGVGIAEEYLPNLFEPFGQERSDLTREFEGMGVGLAVVRHLVDLMGGNIAVDSRKDEGSVFTVQLATAFDTRADGQGAAPARVLLVEQNREEQKLMHHWLNDYVDLSVARSLPEALGEARSRPRDAVLITADFSPDHTAADLLEAFRELNGYEDVPMIVVDDNALPGAAEQFEMVGYDGYIPRPLERHVLLNALGDALAAPPPLQRRLAQAVS